jgi:hypothetical protein
VLGQPVSVLGLCVWMRVSFFLRAARCELRAARCFDALPLRLFVSKGDVRCLLLCPSALLCERAPAVVCLRLAVSQMSAAHTQTSLKNLSLPSLNLAPTKPQPTPKACWSCWTRRRASLKTTASAWTTTRALLRCAVVFGQGGQGGRRGSVHAFARFFQRSTPPPPPHTSSQNTHPSEP